MIAMMAAEMMIPVTNHDNIWFWPRLLKNEEEAFAVLFCIVVWVDWTASWGIKGLIMSRVPRPMHKIKPTKRLILPKKRQMRPK